MDDVDHKLFPLLLRSVLHRTFIQVFSSGYISQDSQIIFDRVFTIYAEAVAKFEEEERERKKLEEASYRYKTKSHEMEEESVTDARIMREMFPNFDEDFADLELDFKPMGDEPQEVKSSEEVLAKLPIEPLDALRLYKMHQHLYNNQFDSHQDPIEDEERVILQQTCYKTACLLLTCINFELADFDKQLLGSHVAMAAKTLKDLSEQPLNKEGVPQSKLSLAFRFAINVYKESSIHEVRHIVKPLQEFIARVEEILAQFPDNEILKSLIVVANRVMSFSVSSPLMKVLNGIEILLRRCNSWEEVAAKHVSVQNHMDVFSSIITRWRRIELESYPQILLMKEHSVELAAVKWWFHLYRLSCLNPEPNADLFESLVAFIETTNYGDFKHKLQMLLTFHNHIEKELSLNATDSEDKDKSRRLKETSTLLINLHRYYSQHQAKVQSSLDEMKKPVEKKLADFIKLAKWDKAINYYRLKEVTDKSHRKLAKFNKEYDVVLRTSVAHLFDPEENLDAAHQVIKPDQSQTAVNDDMYIAPQPPVRQDVVTSKPLRDLFAMDDSSKKTNQMQKIFKRMQGICRKDLFTYFERVYNGISSVEDLSLSIITRSIDLQDKKNRNMKKFAFVELLKTLSALGLSYQKRTISKKQDDSFHIFSQGVPKMPTDVFNADAERDWKKADEYYYRSVLRMSKLRHLVRSHSKELSRGEVEKSLGFSENLLTLMLNQREIFEESLNTIELMGSHDRVFKSLIEEADSNGVMPNQEATKSCLLSVKQYLDGLKETLQEMKQTNAVTSFFDQTSKKVEDALQIMRPCHREFLPGSHDKFATHLAIKALRGVAPIVSQIIAHLENAHDRAPVLFRECLQSLIVKGRQEALKLESVDQTSPNHISDSAAIVKECQDMFADLIIALQLIFQQEKALCPPLPVVEPAEPTEPKTADPKTIDPKTTEPPVEGAQVEAEVEEPAAPEDPIAEGNFALLNQHFYQKIKVLDLENFNDKLNSFFQKLTTWAPSDPQVRIVLRQYLEDLQPLINQYVLLSKRILVDFIRFHRSLCKLEFVLLNVFTSLYTKGFCVPKESEEQEEGDMQTGASGVGLDSAAKGDKDISDEIENEDELEGLKGEKQAEKDEDDPEPKDDEGIDVEMDFEGEEKTMDKQDEEGSEDGSEKEMEEEMGGVDEDNKNVVDEDVWNSEEDEAQGDEKFEKDAPMEKTEEDELAAQQNSDDEKKKKKKEKEKEEKEEENGKNENSDEEAEEFPEVPEDPNAPLEEEERTFKDPKKPEEFEVGEGDPDEEGEDPEPDEEGEEEGDKKDEDPMEIEEPEKKDQVDEPDDEKPDDNPDNNEVDENSEKENSGDDEKMPEDENLTNPHTNEEDGENPEDEDKDKDASEDFNNQLDDEVEQKQEPFGVKDSIGAASSMQREEDEDKQNEDEKQQNNSETNSKNQVQSMDGNEMEDSQGKGTEQPQEQHRRKLDKLNPYRKKGDLEKEWKKRLEIVKEMPDPNAAKGKEENEDREDDMDEDDKAEDKAYRFMDEKEKGKEDQQALAPTADANQDQEYKDQKEKEEEMRPAKDDEEKEEESEMKNEKEEEKEIREKKDSEKKKSAKITPMEVEEAFAGDVKDEMEVEDEAEARERVTDDTSHVISGVKEEQDMLDAVNDEMGEISQEAIMEFREKLEKQLLEDRAQDPEEDGADLWRKFSWITADQSRELCEQLRLLLEPTLTSKLRGDYKTGKRINMKKVIPYIASDFKKDKIWLRRTMPSKRQYQVMLAIDDSKSMHGNHAGQLACEAMTMIANALSQLEVGELGIINFGEDVRLLHPMDEPFTDEVGSRIITQFKFKQNKTEMKGLVECIVKSLEAAKSRSSHTESMQLVFVISDGRFDTQPGLKVHIAFNLKFKLKGMDQRGSIEKHVYHLYYH
eukprot:TRINITY_DN7280_c0_g1_i1.p1 TRINITY_DN7280_c0_g1~~TRINITY_DN7280_c0_g1_i1.p1  ORF type:complete len:2005 (-),score=855.75 TRINITY_DN7280_c0_g1_i1:210-5924(-)